MTIPNLSEGQPVTISLINKLIDAANDTPFDITAAYGGNFSSSGEKLRIESASVVVGTVDWGIGTVSFMRPFTKTPIVIAGWGDNTNVGNHLVVFRPNSRNFSFTGAVPNIPNVRVNYIAIGV